MAYIDIVEYEIKRTCVGCQHNAGLGTGPWAKASQSKDYMWCKKHKRYIHKDEVKNYGCEYGRNTTDDIDYIKLMLESILSTADRMTSGNVSHNINSIKTDARNALNAIKNIEKN